MDLHPEIGRLSGEFRNRYIYQLLQWMEKKTCNKAKKIIVLSEDMKRSLIERDQSYENKAVILNNFSLPSPQDDEPGNANYRKDENVKRMIFAGNVGRYQGLDKIVTAFKAFDQKEKLELVFLGEGAELESLKLLSAGEANIRFIQHQTISVAKSIIRDSDFGIVSLQEKVIRYANPSKTMTYLECGLPILLLTRDICGLGRFISRNRIGFYASTEDISMLHEAFSRILDSQNDLIDRDSIVRFYQERYSQQLFEKKFIQLLENLDG